ncbi:MAG: YfcE family phosphodiesterase [Clostridiales bacterium]|nr:YfcE family phosphodiesterase [Clostridiales bacterium]
MYNMEPDKILYKLVVISDTHHDMARLEQLLPIINSADYLVFCGDGVSDVLWLRGRITVPIVCVKGNNDIGLNVQITDLASVAFGKTKALVTHGHKFGVRQGVGKVLGMAIMKDCKLVFFGHTHRYMDFLQGGVHFINPGALCNGSYALVAGDGKQFVSKQCFI